ncbi:MAG: hypothetical protein AAFW89_00940 [Bacteroidota bacterium]
MNCKSGSTNRHVLNYRILILISITVFVSPSIVAQELYNEVSADSLMLGEVFEYSISLKTSSPYLEAQFPDSATFPETIEVLSIKQFKVSEFADSTVYQLQFFSNQDVILPPLPVVVVSETDTSRFFASATTLYFKSALAESEEEFRPLKPIFGIPGVRWPWIVGALLLAVACYLLYRRWKNKPDPEPAPVVAPVYYINPVTVLEKTLKELRESEILQEERDFNQFYVQLGDAIRTYFEDLYQIPALESTTRELMRYLDAFGADHELIRHCRTILREADMVKFAKFVPTLDSAWNSYNEALNFVERAKLVDVARVERARQDFEAEIMHASTLEEV